METRLRVLGNPAHQMLVVFPMGLLGMSVVFDILHLASGSPELERVAFWMLGAGIIGGLAAVPFGLVDWLQITPATRVKLVGLLQGGGTVVVLLLLFTGSLWLRIPEHDAPALAHLLSFLGLGLALMTGWLGGQLVLRYGVGVHDGVHDHANLKAPSSLSGRPASRKLATLAR